MISPPIYRDKEASFCLTISLYNLILWGNWCRYKGLRVWLVTVRPECHKRCYVISAWKGHHTAPADLVGAWVCVVAEESRFNRCISTAGTSGGNFMWLGSLVHVSIQKSPKRPSIGSFTGPHRVPASVLVLRLALKISWVGLEIYTHWLYLQHDVMHHSLSVIVPPPCAQAHKSKTCFVFYKYHNATFAIYLIYSNKCMCTQIQLAVIDLGTIHHLSSFHVCFLPRCPCKVSSTSIYQDLPQWKHTYSVSMPSYYPLSTFLSIWTFYCTFVYTTANICVFVLFFKFM